MAPRITRAQPQTFPPAWVQFLTHRPPEASSVTCSDAFRWEYLVLSVRTNDSPVWDSEKGRDSVHCGIQYFIDFQSEFVLCSVKSQHPRNLRLAHKSQGLKPTIGPTHDKDFDCV